MPRFPFSSKQNRKNNINTNFQILIDGNNYLEKGEYSDVKKIQYKSKNGIIIIDGLFDLSNQNISELIKLNYLSISFSQELIKSFKLKFAQPLISVFFYILPDSINIIKNNIFILKQKYINFDTDYKTNIKLNLTEFKDINILLFLKGEEKIEIKDPEKEGNEINKEGEINEGEEEIDNPFLFKKVEKEENEVEVSESQNIIKMKKYIKMNNVDNFIFPCKKINNKIIFKYLPKNLKKLSEKIINNNSLTINSNNQYPIINPAINKDNQTGTIEIKNISFNEDLDDLKEIYQNDTILDFLNLLIKNDNSNKKNYINNDKKYNYYIQRLEKIISTLKLFHVLFLNCFLNDNNIEKASELFDNYFSEKVQTMRKKILIEWCIDEEKTYIKKTDLINKNKTLKRNLLSQQIISFGQIKTAINSNNKKNLFINSKLSNLSMDNSKNTFSYFIKTQNKKNNLSNTFISYEQYKNDDHINNNWVSFLLQSLLYIENSNEYIMRSIQLIEEKIKYMNNKSKPYMTRKDNNGKDILHLNYLLLKIYEKIMDEPDDFNHIEEYINMLSNNNLFNTNNSDHYLQYILLFLFIKIINIILPDLNNN